MATFIYAGDALAVAQVGTVQITGMDGTPSNTTYILTINGKTVSVVGDTDEDTTAEALKDAWNASTQPEFAEVTATQSTDTITLTADTAGKPFTVVASVSGGTGTIGAYSATTANSGPETWTAENVINESTGARALPGALDTILFKDTSANLKYGLETSCVALNAIFYPSYTGEVGLPAINSDGTYDYTEYRTRYFTMVTASATVTCGLGGAGDGSSKIRVAAGVTLDVKVYDTGSSLDDLGAFEILCDSESLDSLKVLGGDVSVDSSDTTDSIASVIVSGSGSLTVFSSMSHMTAVALNDDATFITYAPVDSLIMRGNPSATIYRVKPSATDADFAVYGGLIDIKTDLAEVLNSLTLSPGTVLDTNGITGSLTITTTTMSAGSSIVDSGSHVTFTNAIDLGLAGIEDVTLDLGKGYDIQKS